MYWFSVSCVACSKRGLRDLYDLCIHCTNNISFYGLAYRMLIRMHTSQYNVSWNSSITKITTHCDNGYITFKYTAPPGIYNINYLSNGIYTFLNSHGRIIFNTESKINVELAIYRHDVCALTYTNLNDPFPLRIAAHEVSTYFIVYIVSH